MLSQMQLDEPPILAMVNLLETSLPANVTALNATITDGYTIDTPAQYLPIIPFGPILGAGLPAIGVTGLGATFMDDLVFDVDARHELAVVVTVQNADYVTLTWQVRRLLQAIVYTIQQDRILGPAASVMCQQGGLYSVNLARTEPGPLLGDIDPLNDGAPPKSFISWTWLVFNGTRKEVNA